MSNIVPFEFEGSAVRVIKIEGDPWFVAADVCRVLDLSNPTMALAPLDADERAKRDLGHPYGEANVINESGLYTLILRCRDATKPGTTPHRLRKWVTAEVLPAIRKTGGYGAPALPDLSDPLVLQSLLIEHTSKRIEAEKRAVAAEKAVVEMEPKAAAHDRLAGAEGSLCITVAAKTLQVRPKDLTAWMMASGWVYRRPGGNLLGYQRHTENGDLEHKVTIIPRPDGMETIRQQVRVTPQGLTKLARLVPGRPVARAVACVPQPCPPGLEPSAVFAFRVRSGVEKLNIPASTLSRMIGRGKDYIRDIIAKEPRKQSVTYDGLVRLAMVLDCDVEYLTLQQDTPRRNETARRQLLPDPKRWQQ